MNVETIWQEYQASLKAFLHRNVSNSADVDDLLQEILIKVYQKLDSVKESKKIKSWLFQIANNTIIDFYRKRGSQRELSEDDLWYKDDDPDLLQQLSSCVEPFIDAMPKEEAEILTAIEINGLSQKEYAKQSGINYSTLKSRVQKGRRSLFSLFDECCALSLDEKGNLIKIESKGNECHYCR
ncbi:RNA polymerase sigma factor SigZ [Vibrio sp. SS-MA-C1-2]|uniref:RNA polymerase sigma factor SigZ n=1 Tax=Vibrio sp. SS-MA-C1-2 TaxID=2908646 RepID=UPI001F163077|nr:RNA polymerase sigma factor SigZ [Vibrio sp. SS-MA-C1-2]UJF19737.1 RNA polymerase sigma factor SigZ [Vibrio sp. SS-MA-C1-2]